MCYSEDQISNEKKYLESNNHIYMDLYLRLTLARKTVTSKLKYFDLSYFRDDSIK